MKQKPNEDGSAFPVPVMLLTTDGKVANHQRDALTKEFQNAMASNGMSLRAYFAARAPVMSVSWYQYWERREMNKVQSNDSYIGGERVNAIAEWNVLYADAMIKALGIE